MNLPMIGHRGTEFPKLYHESAEGLKLVFGTQQDVLVLSSSGTSALEAAAVNAVSPGDEVIVVVAGAFGDRFASICERYGAVTHRLDVKWGEACESHVLRAFLDEHPKVKAVFLTYCETSTAVLNPVAELASIVKEKSDALVVVDGVSCIGAVSAQMDQWEVDILVSGSQKALMLPPGLAFVAVSSRAWEVIEENEAPSFYLDLRKYKDSQEKGMTPYTPAVSLFYGLAEVCSIIREEGFDNVVHRHEVMKEMTREGMRALDLPLLTDDANASPTVTAITGDDQLDIEKLRKLLKEEYHIAFAGGQKKLKGNLMRIGHMGWCFPADVLMAICYIEMGLRRMGVKIDAGAGVRAAEEVYLNNV
ncbi:MAG TPA: alanine--glyoxylate aminotransferase family protein, partial [Bacillales bacterium]|nr:alanine--glyoxylate aminotransferase family protein [Bacillales bacterium]